MRYAEPPRRHSVIVWARFVPVPVVRILGEKDEFGH